MRSQFRGIAMTAVVALAMAACDGGSSPPTAPTVTLTSSETDIGDPIPSGHDVTLTWSSTHASSCAASGAWFGPLGTSGFQKVVVGGTATYSISCSGRGGVATASVTVRVWYPPGASITADRTTVPPNGTVLLTWSSQSATTCRGVSGLSGTLPTSGSQTSAPLTETTAFAIECSNPWGLAADATVVTVLKFTVTELPMDSAIDLNDAGFVLGQVHAVDGQTSTSFVSAVVWILGANREVLGCRDLVSNCDRSYLPVAMNSNPTVIGSYKRAGSVERSPFVWQVGGDRLFEYAYDPASLTGINDAGQMIGGYNTPMRPEWAFVTTSDGTHNRIDLGDLGGYGGHASAINNAGHIAGHSPAGPDRISHVFLWVDGVMTDLGTLDGASSHAADINMADEIVGSASADAPIRTRAFRYADSKFTDLGSFGGAWSAAAAINDVGQIVGGSTLAGEEPQALRAFLHVDGTMYDLNDLIDPMPDTLVFASRINNRGQILAHGQCEPGDCRSYLLTPVSPP